MQILRDPGEFRSRSRKISLAIGMFDGVHLGHQQVIRQAVADAEQHEGLALAVTFDRHPNTIVAPNRVPPLIYSQPQKLRAIDALGVDAALLIHFDHTFSLQSGEAFVRSLAAALHPLHSVCVGSSFTFGHRRGGNVELLKRLGAELNFAVHGLAAVALDGEMVSSTRIREMIRDGNLDGANQMLGREYALCGEVVRGDQLGHKLGFPTANMDSTGLVLPPGGVYAVHCYVNGQRYRAVANIGHRPTLQRRDGPLRVEAHLLDFNGNLYGAEMELTFVEKLRDEQRFPSIEHLQKQITADVERARELF